MPRTARVLISIFALAWIPLQPVHAVESGRDLFVTARTFKAGAINTNIAAADFNGDGFLDLAVGNQNGGVNVLLGNGHGSLGPPANFAAGNLPEGVATGDFNGDGKPDIAVANFGSTGSGNVSILLGKGDGTFETARNFYAGVGPYFILAADFNRDGKLDLAVTNEAGSADTISILLGNGDGTFQAPLHAAVGLIPADIAVGDLNDDGIPDAVVANAGDLNNPGTTVSVLLGKGDGTFHPALTITVGNQPEGVALADFNGDGKLDLAVANDYDSTVSILLGNGAGSFKAFRTYPAGAFPNSIVALREGSQMNLAVGYNAGMAIMPGQGDGTFGASRLYGPAGASVIAADFNNDGQPDIAADAPNGIAIYLGSVDGQLQAERLYAVARLGVPVGYGPDRITHADFNGDGIPDLAVANFNTYAAKNAFIDVFLGAGHGLFQPHRIVLVGPAANLWGIAAGDINGDGKPDLMVGAERTNGQGSVRVLLSNGDGTFKTPIDTVVGQQNDSIVIADFNRDGIADLAVGDAYTNSLFVLLGKGDGTFQTPVHYSAAQVTWLAAVDLNHDGKLDLVGTAWSATGGLSVFLGNGDGTFQTPTVYPTRGWPTSPAVGDFNGDGRPDVAVGAGLAYVFPGNGDGTFASPLSTPGVFAGNSPVAADFNGDGKLDLAGTTSAGVSVLFGNGDGTFLPAANFATGQNNASGLVVGDFNLDRAPDLATANYWDDNVAVLINEH